MERYTVLKKWVVFNKYLGVTFTKTPGCNAQVQGRIPAKSSCAGAMNRRFRSMDTSKTLEIKIYKIEIVPNKLNVCK